MTSQQLKHHPVNRDFMTGSNFGNNMKELQNNSENIAKIMSSSIQSPLQCPVVPQGYNSRQRLNNFSAGQNTSGNNAQFNTSKSFQFDDSAPQTFSNNQQSSGITYDDRSGLYNFRSISLPYLTNEALNSSTPSPKHDMFKQASLSNWSYNVSNGTKMNNSTGNLPTLDFGAISANNSKPISFVDVFANNSAQLLSRDPAVARKAAMPLQYSAPDISEYKHTTTTTTKTPNQRKCNNCDTEKTPVWRRDKKGQFLCNACGLYFKNYQKPRPLTLKKKSSRRRNRKQQAAAAAAASVAAASSQNNPMQTASLQNKSGLMKVLDNFSLSNFSFSGDQLSSSMCLPSNNKQQMNMSSASSPGVAIAKPNNMMENQLKFVNNLNSDIKNTYACLISNEQNKNSDSNNIQQQRQFAQAQAVAQLQAQQLQHQQSNRCMAAQNNDNDMSKNQINNFDDLRHWLLR